VTGRRCRRMMGMRRVGIVTHIQAPAACPLREWVRNSNLIAADL
jgi:hypothetical protein